VTHMFLTLGAEVKTIAAMSTNCAESIKMNFGVNSLLWELLQGCACLYVTKTF
jgi:hypothetical protein